MGNRLQAYALKQLIEKELKGSADFLVYYWKNKRKSDIKLFIKSGLDFLGFKKFRNCKKEYASYINTLRWSKKYLNNQIVVGCKYKNLKKKDFSKYTKIIAGSDQIWHNWGRNENELRFFYLDFAPKEKRATFAPSFGFDVIPDEDYKEHVIGLNGFEKLSCREESGCKLIKEVTKKDALLLPDPTICLDATEWDMIAECPCFIKGKRYLLVYYLGDITKTINDSIDEIAAKEKLQVINISPGHDNPLNYLNPSLFLGLIKYSFYVFTDSYHATVFSVLFHKNFCVTPRKGINTMFNRITTLLSLCQLEDCIEEDKIIKVKNISNEEYKNVDAKLKELRENAHNYLMQL